MVQKSQSNDSILCVFNFLSPGDVCLQERFRIRADIFEKINASSQKCN